MSKLRYSTSISLDGLTAGPDQSAEHEGWWGPNPPFHLPVFVLTHHPRPKLECEGGTTFSFVTDGLGTALAQATAAAGGQHVDICGGATVAKEYLSAGLLDEILLHLVPIFLGAGVSPVRQPNARQGQARKQTFAGSKRPAWTHLKYRVLHQTRPYDGRRDECEDEIAG